MGRAGRPGRPIRRSDGMEYPSASDAARALIAEWQCGKLSTVAGDINKAASRHRGRLKAYGYEWRWLD